MTCKCKNNYNGWTNKETWLVEVYDFFEPEDFYFEISKGSSIYDLSMQLKKLFEEYEENVIGQFNECQHGLILSLYIGASNKIDFEEIADHMIQDYNNEYK